MSIRLRSTIGVLSDARARDGGFHAAMAKRAARTPLSYRQSIIFEVRNHKPSLFYVKCNSRPRALSPNNRVLVSMETSPMVPDSLRRRVEIPRRPIVQHARIIRNARYDAIHQATRLERRISDIERLVGFLADMMLGLISAFFAVVGAAFIDGGANWKHTMCAGVLAFLISMWITNFLFPNATRWCLK